MFCEHCGFNLDEDTRACTNCGTPVISGTTPAVDSELTAEDVWTCEMHREYFWEYFTKGLIGFGIGVVFSFISGSPELFAVMGLLCAGIPYGWNLITRLTGGWTLYGIVLILLYYGFKLFFSLLIGFTIYSPLLFYHLMMSQKPQSTAKSVSLVAFILTIVMSCIIMFNFIAAW